MRFCMSIKNISLFYSFMSLLLLTITPSFAAEKESRLNRLKETVTSNVGYFKSCLLGDVTRSHQEIWSARRNLGIASALLIAGMGIRKLYMTCNLDIMPDITQIQFEPDNPPHEELISLEEESTVSQSAKELAPDIKNDIMEKLCALDHACKAYVKNPGKGTKKNLKNTYMVCVKTINTHPTHKKTIVSLIVPDCRCTAKVLIEQAKEIYYNPKRIPELQKMLQFEKESREKKNNVSPEKKDEIKKKLVPHEAEFKKAMAEYEQNASEENQLIMFKQFVILQRIADPIPIDDISSLDFTTFYRVQEKFLTLLGETPEEFR